MSAPPKKEPPSKLRVPESAAIREEMQKVPEGSKRHKELQAQLEALYKSKASG